MLVRSGTASLLRRAAITPTQSGAASSLLLLLTLLTAGTLSTTGQIIETSNSHNPAFTLSCNQLESAISCNTSYKSVAVSDVVIDVINPPGRYTLCKLALDVMQHEINEMRNYLQLDCADPVKKVDRYTVSAEKYLDSYKDNCGEPRVNGSSKVSYCRFSTTLRCVQTRPDELPTPVTEPPLTTSTKTSRETFITTAVTIATTSTARDTQSTTPSAERREIAGIPKDTFIVVMSVVAFVFLALVIIVAATVCRSRQRPQLRMAKDMVKANDDVQAPSQNGIYYVKDFASENGSIVLSGGGDLDSINLGWNPSRRTPSITPSLLMPIDPDSLVSLKVNGVDRAFVAVPAGSQEAGRRGSLLSDALDARSISTTVSDGHIPAYRTAFTKRRSLSASADLYAESKASVRKDEAQEQWGFIEPFRRERAATTSSFGRLESIGEEIANDSPKTQRYDPYERRASRFVEQERVAGSRALDSGVGHKRRPSMPAYTNAYGMAMQQRYSANGSSFALEEHDDHDRQPMTAEDENSRWPYSSRMRLPRTSLTGANMSPAFPAKKQAWINRRQSVM